MDLELVKALTIILKWCFACENCKCCPLKNYCGKMPLEW